MGTGVIKAMIWHKLLIFLSMGGFGQYIWSAYGITALVLLGLLISTLISNRKLKQKIKQEQQTYYASNT